MDKGNKEVEKTVIKETSESFSNKVEELVWMEDLSYYAAVLQLMEELEYEPEIVSKLITPTLKARLALELEDINLVKKSGKGRLF